MAAADDIGAAEPTAAADADAAGAGISAVAHNTLPKRVALWKLPCPRIGDHATHELFFMA